MTTAVQSMLSLRATGAIDGMRVAAATITTIITTTTLTRGGCG